MLDAIQNLEISARCLLNSIMTESGSRIDRFRRDDHVLSESAVTVLRRTERLLTPAGLLKVITFQK